MSDTKPRLTARGKSEIEALLKGLPSGECFTIVYLASEPGYVSYLLDMLRSRVIELSDPTLLDRLEMVALNRSWYGLEHCSIELKVPAKQLDIPWFMARIADRLESVQLK